jgi:hypothetical protein
MQVCLLLRTDPLSRSRPESPVIIWVSLKPHGLIVPSSHAPITVGGFYYCTAWAARVSIIFTVVRIAPWASQKRVLLGIALVIFLQWLLLVAQMFWVCEKGDTSWKDAPFALCPLGLKVAVTQAVSEYSLLLVSVMADA